uniref:Uncharacterized protein n=1 Tax=Manihot esculenta TaxID=3983 RepID=A0A2C9VVV1_MANES
MCGVKQLAIIISIKKFQVPCGFNFYEELYVQNNPSRAILNCRGNFFKIYFVFVHIHKYFLKEMCGARFHIELTIT